MNPEDKRILDELDAKYQMRKQLGLPKYDEATIVGYAQYLKRVGYSDEDIKTLIDAIRKE